MSDLKSFAFSVDTREFLCRKIGPDDKEYLKQGFQELSQKSKYLRFFGVQKELGERQLKYFTEVDDYNHVAWGILEQNSGTNKAVGIGRFVRDANQTHIAESALTVIDAYQNQGFGRILFAVLNLAAGLKGVKSFRHYVLSENKFVIERMKLLGILSQVHDGGITILETRVFPSYESIPNDNKLRRLSDTMKKVQGWAGY